MQFLFLAINLYIYRACNDFADSDLFRSAITRNDRGRMTMQLLLKKHALGGPTPQRTKFRLEREVYI